MSSFTRLLQEWSAGHPRAMPWNGERDPYKIWLSEIILQQTQVTQGIPYYLRFTEQYPTVADLAAASEDEILNAWQGLGYNTRARNLHRAARQVIVEYDGVFPRSASELQQLHGVGVYTAAAIASFAFGEHVPAVDSNVYRVVSRYCGIEDPLGTRELDQKTRAFLHDAMHDADPRAFNQAIMNFGALQCTATGPDCSTCPFSFSCVAFNSGRVSVLPVRKQRKPRRNRFFHYGVLTDDNGIIMRKRTGRDIWQGMFEFPLIETTDGDPIDDILHQYLQEQTRHDLPGESVISSDRQVLTHQVIHCTFARYDVPTIDPWKLPGEYRFVEYQNLSTFAVPKVIDCYLRANSILLS